MKYTLIDMSGVKLEFEKETVASVRMKGWVEARDIFSPPVVARIAARVKTLSVAHTQRPVYSRSQGQRVADAQRELGAERLSAGAHMSIAESLFNEFKHEISEYRLGNCAVFELDNLTDEEQKGDFPEFTVVPLFQVITGKTVVVEGISKFRTIGC